jgi:hypothetical protein
MMKDLATEKTRNTNVGYSAEINQAAIEEMTNARLDKLNDIMAEVDKDLSDMKEFDKYQIHVEETVVDDQTNVGESTTKTTNSADSSIAAELVEEFEEIEDLGEVLDGVIGVKKDTYYRKTPDNLQVIKTRLESALKASVPKPYVPPKKKELDSMNALHRLSEDEQTELYEKIYLTAKNNIARTLGEKKSNEMPKSEFDAMVRKECDNLLEVAMSRPGKPFL